MRLHYFLLFSSRNGERCHGFLMIIGHSSNDTFHERATEFYDVVTVFVFAECCQRVGSASRVAFSECAGKPVIGHVLNISRILRTDFIDQLVQRPSITFPIKFHVSAHDFCLYIVGLNGKRAIQSGLFVGVTPEIFVTERNLQQRGKIERVEFGRVLKVLQRLFLFTLATQNGTLQFEYFRIVRQSLARRGEFGQRAIIVEVSHVQILGTGEMGFTRIGTKADCGLNGFVRERQSRRRAIDTKKIELLVSSGELAIRMKKCRIVRDRLVQQINCLQEVRFCASRKICLYKEKILGAAVQN